MVRLIGVLLLHFVPLWSQNPRIVAVLLVAATEAFQRFVAGWGSLPGVFGTSA